MLTIEVIIHGLDTPEDVLAVQKRISKIQAQYIYWYVDRLTCPLEQKYKLIDSIIAGLQEEVEKENRLKIEADKESSDDQ